MNKQFLITIFSTIIFLGCKNQTEKPTIEKEIEKWKKSLVESGQLGKPCNETDFNKWIEENPNQIFGISNDLIIKKSDINNDEIEDAFVSMNVGDPCNGGNASSSDFTVLFISKDGKYNINNNITQEIEKGIKEKLLKNEISMSHIATNILSLDDNINGGSAIWIDGDASCCPSYDATFKFNPITYKLTVNYSKN